MNEEKLRKAYESASKHYDMPDFETFKADMQDEGKLSKFRDSLSTHYDVPDFETFKNDMVPVVKKKEETTASPSNEEVISTTSDTEPQKQVQSSASSVTGGNQGLPWQKKSDLQVQAEWINKPKQEKSQYFEPVPETFEWEAAPEAKVVDEPRTTKQKKGQEAFKSDFKAVEKGSKEQLANKEKADQEKADYLNIVNADLIDQEEGVVVKKLQEKYADDGFTFEESGMGDAMIVKGLFSEPIKIDLDPYTNKTEQLMSSALGEYLWENKTDGKVGWDAVKSQLLNNKTAVTDEVRDAADAVLNNKIDLALKSTEDYQKANQKFEETALKQGGELTEEQNKFYLKNRALLEESYQNITDLDGLTKEIDISTGFALEHVKRRNEKLGTTAGALGNSVLKGLESLVSGAGAAAVTLYDAADEALQTASIMYGDDEDILEAGVDYLDYEKRSKSRKETIKNIQSATKDALVDRLGSATMDEYIASEDRSTLMKATQGVAQSIPAMATGFGGMFLQSFDAVAQEWTENPDYENMPLSDLMVVGGSIALIQGTLEKAGLSALVTKNPLGKSLTKKIVDKTIGKMTGKVTKKKFNDLIAAETNSMLANGVIKIVGGTLVEGETGALQEIADIGIKTIYNKTKGKSIFEAPETLAAAGSQVLEAAKMEAIGGALMKGAFTAPQMVSQGMKSSGVKKELVDALHFMADSPELKKSLVKKLKIDIMKGDVTFIDAKKILNDFEEVAVNMRAIPNEIKDKTEAFDLIVEKKKLEKEMVGKEPDLVVDKKARVKEISEQLQVLATPGTEVEAEVKTEPAAEPKTETVAGPKTETKTDQVSIHKENGGSSISQTGEDLFGKPGYSVSTHTDKTKTVKGKEVTQQELDQYKEDNKEALKDPNNFVGTWYDSKSDQTYIDIATKVENKQEAIELGKANNQKAIFDLESGTEIDTGGTGEVTATTETQPATEESMRTKFKEIKGDREQKVVRAALKVVKSLSKIAGLNIYVHDNTDAYNSAIAKTTGESKESIDTETQKSTGEYLFGKKEIHINLDNATAGTVYHEAFHAIFEAKGFSEAQMKSFVGNVKKISNLSASTITKLDRFADNYTAESAIAAENSDRASKGEPKLSPKEEAEIREEHVDTVGEEFVAELFSDLATDATTMSASNLQKLINLVNKLAKSIGLGVVLREGAKRQEVIDFLNKTATDLSAGLEVDLETMNDILNNIPVENTYIETNGTVRSTKSNRKARIIDTVVSEKDIIDVSELEGKPLEIVYYDNFTSSDYSLTNRVSGTSIKRKGEGGPGFSFRPEIKNESIVAAFTTVTKGLNLIQGISSRNSIAGEAAVVGVALQNKETGHLGNKTTTRDLFDPNDGEIARAVSDGVISEVDAVNMLKQAVVAYESTKKGSSSKTALGFTSKDFSSISEFFNRINELSFERRGSFNQNVIPAKPDLKISKATKPHVKAWLKSGVSTLSDYYSQTTEAYTTEAKSHDIVKYINPDLTKIGVSSNVEVSKSELDRAKNMGVEVVKVADELAHTSYPVSLFGGNIGVPREFHSVRDMANDWNVPNPFFKAGRRKNTADPVRIPSLKESSRKVKPSVRKKRVMPKNESEKLTEDKDGNYYFENFAHSKKTTLKPSLATGVGIQTSKEERNAINSVGGLTMLYTMSGQTEKNVGTNKHKVVIPKDKVYYIQDDVNNYYAEAKRQFSEARPGQAFNPNYQGAWITKVANENGYDIAITKWRGNELRAQTTLDLTPTESDTEFGPRFEDSYKVGDDIVVYGTESKVVGVKGDIVSFKNDSGAGTINVVRSKRSIRKKRIFRKANDINKRVTNMKDEGMTNKEIISQLKSEMFTDKEARSAALEYDFKMQGIFLKKKDGTPTNKLLDWAKTIRRKWLLARKFMPKDAFMFEERMEAEIAAELNMAHKITIDYSRFYRRFKGDEKAKEQLNNDFDAYIRGDEDVKLPAKLEPIAKAMRTQVDKLSQMLADSGMVDAETTETIIANLGGYLNRSYRVYDRENWKDEVTEEVKLRARKYIRGISTSIVEEKAILNDVSFEEAMENYLDTEIDKILTADVKAWKAKSKLGSKNMDVFKSLNKKIAPEIRALMGEYTNPNLIFARTVMKQASLAASHRFLSQVRQSGIGVYLYNETDMRPVEFNVQIAVDGSHAMAPLNGLYTTKEIADQFSKIPEDIGKLVEGWMRVVSVYKYAKTILSVATHAKNVIGNLSFLIMNGHINFNEWGSAYNTVQNDFRSMNREGQREKMYDYIRYGVVKQSAGLGEIKAMFKDADWETTLDKKLNPDKKNIFQKIGGVIARQKEVFENAYQAEDDLFKIIALESEASRYSKAMFNGKKKSAFLTEKKNAKAELEILKKNDPNLTSPEAVKKQAELDKLQVDIDAIYNRAAEIVKNTLPSYSRVPELFQKLRRSPLIGSFVAFNAESYRTASNTALIGWQEMSNKKTMAIGLKRYVGAMTYMGAKSAVLSTFAYMAGTGMVGVFGAFTRSEEEEEKKEAIDFFLPEFLGYPDIIPSNVGDGKFTYVDISANDPWGAFNKTVNAGLSADGVTEGLIRSAKEFIEPFIGTELATDAALQLQNNTDGYGSPIYNITNSAFDQNKDITNFIWGTVQPGTITSLKRVVKSDEKLMEIIAAFTGYRSRTVDVGEQAGYKVRDINKNVSLAKQEYNSGVRKYVNGEMSYEDLDKIYVKANSKVKEIYSEIREVWKNAETLGVKDGNFEEIMKDKQITKSVREQVLQNVIWGFESKHR